MPPVSSVTQSCPTLFNPMDCITPGFPVPHYLLELAQTHVHWVSDAIQPSCPLSSPSPPALNLSQHQGLFQWVVSFHQLARVLELQHQSFQWIFRELVRNAESGAPPQTTKASSSSLHILPWRSTALKNSKRDVLEGRFGVLEPQQCLVGKQLLQSLAEDA